jgi:hypothetical protein
MARKRSFARGSNPSVVILGGEPQIDSSLSGDDLIWAINKTITWYRNNFRHTQYKSALRKYMTSSYSEEEVQLACSAPKREYVWEHAGIYSHLSNRGVELPEAIQKNLDESVRELIDKGKRTEKSPVNVQENIKNKISDMIGDIEVKIDEFLLSLKNKNIKSTFDITEWIKENNIRAVHASRIADFFAAYEKELILVLSGKDDQLKEGYSWLSKPNQRKYKDFISRIVQMLREQSKIINSQRKPRKKKKKSAEQIVSKLQYMKEFPDLNLKSVDPREIVGSSRVILYNPAKKMLYFYEKSELGDGLNVKVSKIVNYDTEKSSRKRIRDPKILQSGGKFVGGLRASAAGYNEIKSKKYPVSGRISSDYIIVQVLHK